MCKTLAVCLPLPTRKLGLSVYRDDSDAEDAPSFNGLSLRTAGQNVRALTYAPATAVISLVSGSGPLPFWLGNLDECSP